ncbi:hypothetical protein A3860_23390 [Niastella vici]|uniref:DUF4266 domain-containing protein n=1 Tax=Niastella vici TaxID=1703345 RepID=A0A1V9FZT8_9BACT|nr:DUF4266 domain-containing protein [Niastella vici]OQP63881.1 hypothetical protein A3860_23390 [Niastella vici]
MNGKTKIMPVFLLAMGMLMLATTGCQPVKEYQKSKINDGEMNLSNRKVEKTELSFQGYREGASGANAGKSGGGCGCN